MAKDDSKDGKVHYSVRQPACAPGTLACEGDTGCVKPRAQTSQGLAGSHGWRIHATLALCVASASVRHRPGAEP